ncbi:hypothetical protein [Schlesneria sp. T3-172]|uniref:hypothetical protein n=1 Tax=Schlesneria sphaerica TaxID=3373610 RepID=UPI0037CAC053
MANRSRYLVATLRAIGVLDLFAFLAVVAPRSWINASHQSLGMGDFPSDPIAGYLARSTSLWYVGYGLLLWYLAADVQACSRIIALIAWLMMVQGGIVMGIDWAEGMPVWWTALEGPCCIGLGALILILQRWSAKEELPGTTRSGTEST